MLRTPVAWRMLVFGGEGGYVRGGLRWWVRTTRGPVNPKFPPFRAAFVGISLSNQ